MDTDLIEPVPRKDPQLIIIVSCVVLLFGIVLAIIFVDEDDVIKCFISEDEKTKRKIFREQSGVQKKSGQSIMPIFAEALDNLATTSIALTFGCLLYAGIAVPYLYLIDDIGNIVISVIMEGKSFICEYMYKRGR